MPFTKPQLFQIQFFLRAQSLLLSYRYLVSDIQLKELLFPPVVAYADIFFKKKPPHQKQKPPANSLPEAFVLAHLGKRFQNTLL